VNEKIYIFTIKNYFKYKTAQLSRKKSGPVFNGLNKMAAMAIQKLDIYVMYTI
jgi:hypothetical protein